MKSALVVDDHPVTHLGCRRLLSEAGYDPISEARDAPGAYRIVERAPPDLIVLDLGLPGVGGLQMLPALRARAPSARILVFSMNESPAFAARALQGGAQGYLSKNSRPEDFATALKALERGQVYLESALALDVAALSALGNANPLNALSPREHQVLRLVGKGMRHEEIATAINVSYKTVANTCATLKRKLNARSLPDLIRIAITLESEAAPTDASTPCGGALRGD